MSVAVRLFIYHHENVLTHAFLHTRRNGRYGRDGRDPPVLEDIQKAAGRYMEKESHSHQGRHIPADVPPLRAKAALTICGMCRASVGVGKHCSPLPDVLKARHGHRSGRKIEAHLDDRENLDSLSARVLIWNSGIIAPRFLRQPAWNVAPDTSRQSRVKIEATPYLVPAPGPPIVVKAEPQSVDALAGALRASAVVKMRASNEGGLQIFELLSDSEPEADNRDSDLEVMEALQNTVESSSPIHLPVISVRVILVLSPTLGPLVNARKNSEPPHRLFSGYARLSASN
ncbi:hypothetical protein B0H12DRAFT_1071068 [Mycena haematopus]|nr:hypothetical protein B0H12DRAFT_1071068 [Mycena haematopus]